MHSVVSIRPTREVRIARDPGDLSTEEKFLIEAFRAGDYSSALDLFAERLAPDGGRPLGPILFRLHLAMLRESRSWNERWRDRLEDLELSYRDAGYPAWTARLTASVAVLVEVRRKQSATPTRPNTPNES